MSAASTAAEDVKGRTAVSNTPLERVDRVGLAVAGQPALVALAVQADVLGVVLTELLASLLDHLIAAVCTHLLCREVGVAASPVPVVGGDGLGVKRDDNTLLLTDTVEKEAGQVHLVARINTNAGTNLVFPLPGHDLTCKYVQRGK